MSFTGHENKNKIYWIISYWVINFKINIRIGITKFSSDLILGVIDKSVWYILLPNTSSQHYENGVNVFKTMYLTNQLSTNAD